MNAAAGGDKGRVRTVEVGADADGQRIDNFLLRELRGVPRTRIYRLLRRGEVRVNGGRARPARRLASGDRVRIPPVRAERYADGALPAHLLGRLRDAVLYEDADALVIDKPAGLAVHAGTGLGGGVVDGLRTLRPDIGRLELVHRLDRDTSGCLLLAKGRPALRRLQEALRRGELEKTYRALLVGTWPGPEATVDAPLRRDVLQSGERMVRVDPAGRAACSHFRHLRAGQGLTLVEVRIETGRTHQIRVHAAHLGYPVAGDRKYGDPGAERRAIGRAAPRLWLHASRLGFPGAQGPVVVESPLPDELESAVGARA
ncbi:MAG: RluA family pseudouridine synthase [Halofilum sp. (in: g-proteobacteria)]|nr:RluA family pseudouridine synthase [Halofilum sp. (in: g-proteobacteria)]